MSKKRLFINLTVLLAMLAAISSHARAQSVPDEIIGLTVKKVEIVAPLDFSKSRISRLSAIKQDAPLTNDRISKTLQKLYLDGRIKDVKIWAERIEGGLKVKIEIIPIETVRELIFWGNFKFNANELRDIVDVARGDEFSPELLDVIETRIKEAYEQYGFFEVEIKTKVEDVAQKNEVDVQIFITEGPRYKMGELHIRGKSKISDEKITKKLNWSKGGKFNQTKLESKLKKLASYYRNQGYVEATISKPRFVINRDAKQIHAHIRIDSGKKVEIEFSKGFTPWQRRQSLPKELGLKKARRINRWVAQDMKVQIETYFQSKGFYDVAVEQYYNEDENQKFASFAMILGEKYKISEVKFDGNRFIAAKELLKVLDPPKKFERTDFKTILTRIVRLYNERGFFFATADVQSVRADVEKRELAITIGIVEGARIILDKLTIEGSDKYEPDKLKSLVAIEEGAPLNPFLLDELVQKIAARYLEEGYLRVEVNWEIQGECDKAEGDCVLPVIIKVSEGSRYRYGDIYIRGLRLTKREVVERELFELRKGEPFRQDQILSVEQALLLTPYFKGVHVERITLDEDEPEIDLAFEMKERDCGYATVGLGYDSYEKFKGALELGHKNLGGYGRMLSFYTEAGIADPNLNLTEHAIKVHFVWPWVTQLPMDGVVDLFDTINREQSFTIRATGTSLSLKTNVEKLLRRLRATREQKGVISLFRFYSVALTYQIEEDFVYDVEEGAEQDKGRLRLASISPAIVRDARDDPFNPMHGAFSSISTEFSNKVLASDSNYIKLIVQHSMYQRLGDFIKPFGDIVIAANVRVGFAWPLWPDEALPIQKRYFLGGRTTVRGFGESEIAPQLEGDPIGGNFLYLTNLELRIPLAWGLGTVLFWDSGAVTEDVEAFDYGEVRDTIGTGLSYLTPVGPLSAIVGFKIDKRHYESAGEFYITIGHTF